jgi:hypothetical protein
MLWCVQPTRAVSDAAFACRTNPSSLPSGIAYIKLGITTKDHK